MNAKEATEKALHIRSDEYQIGKIKEYIGQAASKGMYELTLDRQFKKEIVDVLEADGFTVVPTSQNVGTEEEPNLKLTTQIIWYEEPKVEAKMEVVND